MRGGGDLKEAAKQDRLEVIRAIARHKRECRRIDQFRYGSLRSIPLPGTDPSASGSLSL